MTCNCEVFQVSHICVNRFQRGSLFNLEGAALSIELLFSMRTRHISHYSDWKLIHVGGTEIVLNKHQHPK